jgi:cytochrome P450
MDIDLLSARNFAGAQPHEQFAWLREHAPVFRHPDPAGGDFWVITRYEDLKAIGRDTTRFSSMPTVMLDDPSAEQRSFFGDRTMMLTCDPPAHSRMRRLVAREFTPRAAAAMRSQVDQLATKIVDDVIADGECDLVRDLAGAMPSYVIAEMLGIPLQDGLDLYNHTETLHSTGDSVAEGERHAALGAMFSYAQQVFDDKSEHPGDDLASLIIHGEIDDKPIDNIDFFLWFLLLIDAGGDTTRNLVGGGFHTLFQHPDQLEMLRSDPDGLLPNAIEELLRWVSPVIYMRRTAAVDLELRGQQVKAGDRVVMYYGAANRDPDCVTDPDRFDITRTENRHVAFGGGGAHFCLGANLARIEISSLMSEILRRLDGLAPSDEPRWMASNFIFGPTTMPVTFTPGERRIQSVS